MKVQSIYNSKILKKGLEFAATNGSLFAASASLAFSTARPLIILATPDTDKENKRYACTKSMASTIIGYLMMLCASIPVANAVKNIDDNPATYIKQKTIRTLQAGEKTLNSSKKYSFVTQLFKLGLGFIIAAPKSFLTCILIPPIMLKLFNKKNNTGKDSTKTKNTTFTGNFTTTKLSKIFGKIMDTKTVQNLAEKYHNTRFEQHMIALSDTLATASFAGYVAHTKDISENRKKPLIYNSILSTAFSIAGMYTIDSITSKPTEKFTEKFIQVNKNSPKLSTYLEGIRVAKPVLILGALYYIVIPLVSTYIADKFAKSEKEV